MIYNSLDEIRLTDAENSIRFILVGLTKGIFMLRKSGEIISYSVKKFIGKRLYGTSLICIVLKLNE